MRLARVSNLDTTFLFKIVDLIIKLVYDNSGHVFTIMNDQNQYSSVLAIMSKSESV